MSAHHHQNHNHGHGHAPITNRRRLSVVLVLTGIYLIAEVVGGVLTNSLALLSDAGHMLTDVGALALALVAIWFGTRPATPQKSYGYYRLEILAALVNGLVLLGISAFIVIEALVRLRQPPDVNGSGMLLIAIGGLVINLAGAYMLHGDESHSLNVRAAFYHVLSDALGSLGAVVAGWLIYRYGWYSADPIIAIVIAVLIVVSALALVREAADVLLEATPAHVDTEKLRQELFNIPGVVGVHDLHAWTITSGMYALSCHVVVHPDGFTMQMLEKIRHVLHLHSEIRHQTVQLETEEMAKEEELHL